MMGKARWLLAFGWFGTMFFAPSTASAALHLDVFGGISFASPYTYFDKQNTRFSQQIEYHAVIGPTAGLQLSVDIYKEMFRIGIHSSFLRRYDVQHAVRQTDGSLRYTLVGEISSIPLTFLLEGEWRSLFFGLGIGTAFTWTTVDPLAEPFLTKHHFGFFFAAGYAFRLSSLLSIVLRAEFLVNMPTKHTEELPPSLKQINQELDQAAYNVFGQPSVFFNFSLTLGLRFSFAKDARIPLEKVFPSWPMDRKKPPTSLPTSPPV
jgi:hypothetical protein